MKRLLLLTVVLVAAIAAATPVAPAQASADTDRLAGLVADRAVTDRDLTAALQRIALAPATSAQLRRALCDAARAGTRCAADTMRAAACESAAARAEPQRCAAVLLGWRLAGGPKPSGTAPAASKTDAAVTVARLKLRDGITARQRASCERFGVTATCALPAVQRACEQLSYTERVDCAVIAQRWRADDSSILRARSAARPAARAAAVPAPNTTSAPIARAAATSDKQAKLNPDDLWRQLGFAAPTCKKPSGVGRTVQRNCRGSGAPFARYPLGRYAVDSHVKIGLGELGPSIPMFLLGQVFSFLWIAIVYALSGALTLLAYAFDTDLFGATSGRLSRSMRAFYDTVTAPWLQIAVGLMGMFALYTGILRQRRGEMWMQTLAALAMMTLAFVIVHQPKATVGELNRLSEDASKVLIAGPSNYLDGQSTAPASFHESTSRLFSRLVVDPWCAMQFGDVKWCRAPMSGKERAEVVKVLEKAKVKTDGLNTRADAWLRLNYGSEHREALYKVYAGDPGEEVSVGPVDLGTLPLPSALSDEEEGLAPEKVAMQGKDGLWSRGALTIIIVLGFLGAILHILWLSLKLLFQATVTLALLLAGPFALLMPAFGDAGREAFSLWARTLLGSILAKVVYGLLLGVSVAGFTILSATAGDGNGWGLAFLLASGYWWAMFMRRQDIINFLAIGPQGDQSNAVANLAGMYLGMRAIKGAGQLVSKPARAAAAVTARAKDSRREAVRAVSRDALGERLEHGAEQARNSELAGAQHTVATDRARQDELTDARREEREAEQELRAADGHVKALEGEGRRAMSRAAAIHSTADMAPDGSFLHEADRRRWQEAKHEEHLAAQRLAPARAQQQTAKANYDKTVQARTNLEHKINQNRGDVDRARQELRRGSWGEMSDRDRAGYVQQMRRDLDVPADDERHAWRVGMTAGQYSGLTGAQRTDAIERVRQSIDDDRKLLAVTETEHVPSARDTRSAKRVLIRRGGSGTHNRLASQQRGISRTATRDANQQALRMRRAARFRTR